MIIRFKLGMWQSTSPVEPPRKDLPAFTANGMAPTRDFFAMFDVPAATRAFYIARRKELHRDVTAA